MRALTITRRCGLNNLLRLNAARPRPNPERPPLATRRPPTRRGNRLFELGLGEAALALTAASSKSDQATIADLLAAHGADGFAAAWLRHKEVAWAAELLPTLAPEASR